MSIRRLSDNLIRYKGPTKFTDGTILNEAYLQTVREAGDATASCKFSVYDESKEHTLFAAKTRTRDDIAATLTSVTVPHTVPQWIEVKDVISIRTDEGQEQELLVSAITSVGAGDPVTFSTTPLNGKCSAGAPITLVKKGQNAVYYPVAPKDRALNEFGATNKIEIEREGTTSQTFEVLEYYATTVSTEITHLRTALNQEEYPVIKLSGSGISSGTVAVGSRIRRYIVRAVAMTEYGADATWTDTDPTSAGGGFQGTFEDSLIGVEAGQLLRVEIAFDAGPGLQDVVSTLEVVVEG